MSSPTIEKGIIAAAGAASRMWPASKVFPKELFPLGRLPILAHVIGEMLDAGIHDITIVVRNDNSRAIEALLDARIAPPASVQQDPVVRRFEHMIRTARFTLVEQNGPYGNGTPLLNGAMTDKTLRPCVFAFADDVVLGENVSRGLIDTFERTRTPVLAAQPVPERDVAKFGILECEDRNGASFVTRFVEKPRAGETSSRLASIGRYLVTPQVIEALQQTPVGKGNELWLADAFVRLLDAGSPAAVYPLQKGTWYTVGNPEGFAAAVAAATQVADA